MKETLMDAVEWRDENQPTGCNSHFLFIWFTNGEKKKGAHCTSDFYSI